MDEKQLQALFDAMQSKLELGDFATFKSQIGSDDKFRKAFYTEASNDLDLGDFNAFEESFKKKVSTTPSAKPAPVSGPAPVSPSKLPSPSALTYNDIELVIEDTRKKARRLQDLREAPMASAGIGAPGMVVPKPTLDQAAQELKLAEDKKKEVLTRYQGELSRPVERLIETGEYKSFFTKDGVFDEGKARDYFKKVTQKYGGGSHLQDQWLVNLKTRGQQEIDKPRFNQILGEEMKKNNLDLKQYSTQVFNQLTQEQRTTADSLKKERDAEALKLLNGAEAKAKQYADELNKAVNSLNDQIKAGVITNEEAAATYDQLVKQYETTIKGIDNGYKDAIRKMNVRINGKFDRIEQEVRAINSSIDSEKVMQSLPPDVRKRLETAYQAAGQRLSAEKNEAKKKQEEVTGIGTTDVISRNINLALKSLTSGFNRGLAEVGEYLDMKGLSGSFVDVLRNRRTAAETFAPAQYEWNKDEWLKRAISSTGTSLGASVPILLPTIGAVALTGGGAAGALAAGALSFAGESAQIGGGQFREGLEETGDVVAATKRAEEVMRQNTITAPLYFIGGLGDVMITTGKGLSKVATGIALEQAEEIPTEYIQSFNEAKAKGYNKGIGDFIKENPEIAADTFISTVGQSGAMKGIASAFSVFQKNVPASTTQMLTDAVSKNGVEFTNGLIDKWFEAGKINQKTVAKLKAEVAKIQTQLPKMQEAGVDVEKAKLMSSLSSQSQELQNKINAEKDPAVKALYQNQLNVVNQDISQLVKGETPYVVFTLPGGGEMTRVMTVREFNALPAESSNDMVKNSDGIKVVGDDALNTQLTQKKQELGVPDAAPGVFTQAAPQVPASQLSKTKDAVNDTPILKSAASNFEVLYVPKSVYELAYENDLANKNRTGGPQTLDTIIKRGGYTIEEFDKLLPNWRQKLAPEVKTEAPVMAPAAQELSITETITPESIEVSGDATEFANQMQSAQSSLGKAGMSVSPYTQEEYNDIASKGGQFFRAAGNKVLALLKPNGEIVSLVKDAGVKAKGAAQAMISKMKDMGGLFMDNYDIYLTPLYEKAGYKVVARVPFNEQFAPEGWDAADSPLKNKPDVVFMVRSDIAPDQVQNFADYEAAQAYTQNVVDGAVNAGLVKLPTQIAKAAQVKPVADRLRTEIFGDTQQKVASAQKALEKTGVVIQMIADPVEFDNKVAQLGGQRGMEGVFLSDTGEILINQQKLDQGIADGRVIWHEASHPVVNIVRNTNRQLFDQVVAGLRQAAADNKGVADALAWAESQYAQDGQGVVDDEAVVETIAGIAEGMIDISKLPTGLKQSIIDLINRIARALGLGQVLDDTDIAAFKKLAGDIANALTTGQDVSQIVGEENIKATQNEIEQLRKSSAAIAKQTEDKTVQGAVQPSMVLMGKQKGQDVVLYSGPASIEDLKRIKPDMYVSRAVDLSKSALVQGKTRMFPSNASAESKLKWADSVYAKSKDTVVSNLLFLFDSIPSEIRDISKLWYDGANIIAQELAKKYNTTIEQAAGVMASQSPQKPWYDNVHLAHFIMDFYANKKDMEFTQEMYDYYALKSQPTKQNPAGYPKQIEYLPTLKQAIGKKFADLSNYDRSVMIRADFDNNYERRAPLRIPTGEIVGRVSSMSSFSGYDTIAKGVSILENGSEQNISDNLGKAFKVRNFNNNISDPRKDGEVTIDTHAMAAAYLLPLGASSPEVKFDEGTYAFFADAYRDAAKQRGVLAREMQSIVWEGVRSVFPAAEKSEANKNKAKEIWSKYKDGTVSLTDVQNQIKENGKDLSITDWSRFTDTILEENRKPSYLEELPLAGRDQLAAELGDGGRDIGGVPGMGEGGVSPSGRVKMQARVGRVSTDTKIIDGFYSPIENRINDFKQPKASVTKWKEIVGVKSDEAVFSGMSDWLNSQKPDAQLSKQDVLNFMKENRIEINEVVKSDERPYDIEKKRLFDKYGVTSIEELRDNATEAEMKKLFSQMGGLVQTKYSQYQLPGGENYKEVLITLPGKDQFESSHFDETNIITHLRMNTRTDADGKKVLFLEEVQSDWGQKGKREGFKGELQKKNDEIIKKSGITYEEKGGVVYFYKDGKRLDFDDVPENVRRAIGQTVNEVTGVTPAPFVTNTNAWVKLGLKVALKEAVNQGADRIAWTTGEQQNERYDLSKQVDEITYSKNNDTYDVTIWREGDKVGEYDLKENELEGVVGKDVAQRMVEGIGDTVKYAKNAKSLSGINLSVGGKGMKAFYGDAQTPGIVANVAKALVKELTGKEGAVVESEIRNYDIPTTSGVKYEVYDSFGALYRVYQSETLAKAAAEQAGGTYKSIEANKKSTQPAIDITPELRQEVQAGMPQFSKGSRMESSKDFKLAAFVMREKADGAPMSEIVSGIASVFPNMSPQEIKDLVDDPETWLRNKYANLSKAMQDNLIARARVKNIYAPRTGSVAPAFQGLEVPMSKIEEATQAPTFKERVDKVFTNFKNKFIDPAKGLPDWIISLKDFAGGTKQIEISRAELTIRQLKEVAKKIGFKDWDTFAAALKSIPQPIQQPVGAGTGMVGFNPSVAAAGAPYTIPNSMLPQTTPPAVQALPLEIIPFVYKMRGQIDGLTKDLIASGYVTPEQAAKLEANIGQYVNRAYRLYNEKGWRPDQDQIRETTKFLADQYIKQLATDNAGVLTYEQIEKQAIEKAKRDVNEILDKKTNPYFAAKSESRNMGILKERKDIPEPIRKLMGEYTDPGTVFIMTVAKQAALKASSEYLTKVRNMGMGTLFFEENDPKRPASASVQIAAEGSDTKSPLNGLYTMPEVAEAMETVNPTYNDVVNIWMKVVGAVRWGKTVGSVKTQLLNFESNLGFAVMNGLLMTGATGKAFNASRKYVAGQYSSKELGEITQKVIQLGLVGQGVNATELAKMLGSGDIHDIALDLAVNPDSKYRMVKKAPGKALGVLNKLYRMGDDFWKVYAYMNERELVAGAMFDKKYTELTDQEKADVDIESSERVKSTWPTYDRVFPAVKTISQNAPIFGNFISFRAESIRVLANTIAMAIKDMKTPGFEGLGARRMAGILSYIAIRTGATYAFAQAVGMAASGLTGLLFGGDDEEERKKRAFKQAAPSFMATQDIAVIPTKEKHKFIVYSLSGIDPYNTTFNTLNALTDGTATMQPGPAAAFTEFFGGFLSPEMTFKTVWAIITNTDPDSGNRIVGKTDEGADAYAKIGAYIFDKLEPSTMTMVQRLAGDNPSAELASLVGARPYPIDLHESFSFALSDMARQMKEINDEYSFVQFNKKATEDEKALAQKEAEQKKALLIERMNQRFNDFVLIGANPEELRKLIFDRSPIKTTGFDQQTKFGIINGNVNKELLFK